MIEVGFLERRLGRSVFLIDVAGKKVKIFYEYRNFPEEFARLIGHVCEDIGLIEGLSCQVELQGNEIIDVRFDLDDVVSTMPELSSVDSVLGGGDVAFLVRKCGCSIFITYREVARSNRFDGFKEGQVFKHRVNVRRGKPEATSAVLQVLSESSEISQDKNSKGVVNADFSSASTA